MASTSSSDLGLALPEPTLASIRTWLTDETCASSRDALRELVAQAARGDEAVLRELADAFSGPLPIGTGGRRGQVGAGPNRMNEVVVLQTAQGLVDAMREEGVPLRAVVVYDTRRDSRRFARAAADELVRLGLDVLLIDAPRATPLLSFTIRARGLGAGLVVSASHNPPSDNGIKVYWRDGAQVIGRTDALVMRCIEARAHGRSTTTPATPGKLEIAASAEALREVDTPYVDHLLAQGVAGDLPPPAGFRVVFTPLHGVGHTSAVPALRARGFDVVLVERQCDPDGGNFSSVASANPEDPASMAMGRQLADEVRADLVLATDPDADRLGALVRDASGQLQALDGNRLAVLLLDHVLRLDPAASAPNQGWVLSTMVTTPLVATMARKRGLTVVDDLLVGFKHHAAMAAEAPERAVVLAVEESHGYLRGHGVRDKDGAIAALLLAQCVAGLRSEGQTVFDRLEALWREHGYHREATVSVAAQGTAGKAAVATAMAGFRREAPDSVLATLGLRVRSKDDRLDPRHTGSSTRDLPSDVVAYELADASDQTKVRLVVRPSGTEPKLKVYVLARGPAIGTGDLAAERSRVDTLTSSLVEGARGWIVDTIARGTQA